MKVSWGSDKLKAELEAAKDDLRGLEKNIRKILGRDVPEGENGTAPVSVSRLAQKRPLQEDRRRQSSDFSNNEFGPKRRWQGNNNAEPKTVFSRLSTRVASTADDSGDEDDGSFKPAVSSRVTMTPKEVPSRQEVIRRESRDERSRQRNKRMFGALLGTLQKFRQEETKLKAKEDKKAEVEARVEEAKRKEREELRKERQQLFNTRKERQAQVRALELKLTRSKQYQEWREKQIPLLNFIRTKAQPHIYYLPKKSTPETEALLLESTKELKAEIDRRERALLKDFEMIHDQVGMNPLNKSLSASESHDNSMIEPEEEENRDPNPEKNGDVEMTESHAEIINQSSNHEEREDREHRQERNEPEDPEDREDREDRENQEDREEPEDREDHKDQEEAEIEHQEERKDEEEREENGEQEENKSEESSKNDVEINSDVEKIEMNFIKVEEDLDSLMQEDKVDKSYEDND